MTGEGKLKMDKEVGGFHLNASRKDKAREYGSNHDAWNEPMTPE